MDALKANPAAEPDRIAVVDGSQGGAMALAVGALRDDVSAGGPDDEQAVRALAKVFAE